uniref:Uncharacterized protein n=1 Tax=Sipha flava TaxID=143950 RepID=A0A2S2QGV3_9HEMI
MGGETVRRAADEDFRVAGDGRRDVPVHVGPGHRAARQPGRFPVPRVHDRHRSGPFVGRRPGARAILLRRATTTARPAAAPPGGPVVRVLVGVRGRVGSAPAVRRPAAPGAVVRADPGHRFRLVLRAGIDQRLRFRVQASRAPLPSRPSPRRRFQAEIDETIDRESIIIPDSKISDRVVIAKLQFFIIFISSAIRFN